MSKDFLKVISSDIELLQDSFSAAFHPDFPFVMKRLC